MYTLLCDSDCRLQFREKEQITFAPILSDGGKFETVVLWMTPWLATNKKLLSNI